MLNVFAVPCRCSLSSSAHEPPKGRPDAKIYFQLQSDWDWDPEDRVPVLYNIIWVSWNFCTFEDDTDRQSRNVGKELPLYAA